MVKVFRYKKHIWNIAVPKLFETSRYFPVIGQHYYRQLYIWRNLILFANRNFHLCITLVTLAIIYEIFDQWSYSLTVFFSMFFFDPLFKSPPHCWESHFICNEAKKGISKRVLQKIKCAKFSKKRNFCTPWYAHALVGKKSLWKNWRALLS